MFTAPLGLTTLLIVTYGEHMWIGAVVKLEQHMRDEAWTVEVYGVGETTRWKPYAELDRAFICTVEVDPKQKDPLTGAS